MSPTQGDHNTGQGFPVPSTRMAVAAKSYPHRCGRSTLRSHRPQVNARHFLLTVWTIEQLPHLTNLTSAAQV